MRFSPATDLPAISAGLLAGGVGYASSFAIAIYGLKGVGASDAQAATGLMVLSVVMALVGIGLSVKLRMPVGVAFSPLGVALLATVPALPGGFSDAIGAFLVAGGLVLACGMVPALGRLITAIPHPVANAMLAGILFKMCLAPVVALATIPAQAVPVVAAWAVVLVWRRIWAMPAALVVTLLVMAIDPAAGPAPALAVPGLAPIAPTLSLQSLVDIALPLFLVAMASQNIPGLAVLNANGYHPSAAMIFRWLGWGSLAVAPFGGPGVNLTAITAAICAGPDASPDPGRRWLAAVVAGLLYIGLGLGAAVLVGVLTAAPPMLIQALAGLALTGALVAALRAALTGAGRHDAALVTFLVASSGVSFLGIGAAFWGLVAGGALWLATGWRGPRS